MQLLRCSVSGQSVLVEDQAVVAALALDGAPEPLAADEVYHFSQDLTRLCQGITGVAVLRDGCLPIVSPDYFRPERSPVTSVRTITHLPPVATPGARRFFVFGVPGANGFQFAVSMNQVMEVARALPMAPLNFDHSHLTGVSVWRGETIPVIDLAFAARLGTIGEATPWKRMMVVRNRANRIFAIPTTGAVRQPPAASQVYAPDSVSVRPMRGIRGVFRFEGSPLLVPDLDALVD